MCAHLLEYLQLNQQSQKGQDILVFILSACVVELKVQNSMSTQNS